MVLGDGWGDYSQEIGGIILAYLEYRLGIDAHVRYTTVNKQAVVYTICKSNEEAERIYNTLSPNIDKGVFVKIRKQTSYYTAGYKIRRENNNPWHDRHYRLLTVWMRYRLDSMRYRPSFGYGWELSEVIKPLRSLDARAQDGTKSQPDFRSDVWRP